MSVLSPILTDNGVQFDADQCRTVGAGLAQNYQSASPFPHIALTDFVPADMLRQVSSGYPEKTVGHGFARKQELHKFQYHPEQVSDAFARNFIYALNTEPFLAFLSEMTGIEGLIPDPYFIGGGLHETMRGGYLGIHADFNNHKQMRVRRRLNLLIYLNEGWQESYGGALELWSKDMRACEKSIYPMLGNCVVFNTDLDSMHGQPDPLTCPDGVSRRSIALYYYTAAGALDDQPERTTNFKIRPNSPDAVDYRIKLRHLVKDWTPPALGRLLRKG